MPLPPDAWPATQRAIRELIPFGPDEQIDTVAIAAFLLSHAPNRVVNPWLILTGPHDAGQSALLDLIADRKTMVRVRQNPKYIIKSRDARLDALRRQDGRVLYLPDYRDLIGPPGAGRTLFRTRWRRDWCKVYDGHVAIRGFQTGPRSDAWGPHPPNQRRGLLTVAGRDAFHWRGWGTERGLEERVLFYVPDLPWTDLEQPPVTLGKTEYHAYAKAALHQFLDLALEQLAEFDAVQIDADAEARIHAACELVTLIIGPSDTRELTIRELTRMFAYVRGHERVEPQDLALALRLALVQLDPVVYACLTVAARPERLQGEFTRAAIMADVSLSPNTVTNGLAQLVKVGVLKRQRGKVGTARPYRFATIARRLVEAFVEAPEVVSDDEPDFEQILREIEER